MVLVDAAIVLVLGAVIGMFIDKHVAFNVVRVSTILFGIGVILGLVGSLLNFNTVKTGLFVLVAVGFFFSANFADREGVDAVYFQRLSSKNPEKAVSQVDSIHELLDSEFSETRVAAAAALGNLAEEYPQDVRDAIPRLLELMDDPAVKVRGQSARALAVLSSEYPEETISGLPKFIDMLSERDTDLRIVGEGALLTHIDSLIETQATRELDRVASALTNALSDASEIEQLLILQGLHDIASEHPELVFQAEEPVKSLITHETEQIRNPAHQILSDLAVFRGELMQTSLSGRI